MELMANTKYMVLWLIINNVSYLNKLNLRQNKYKVKMINNFCQAINVK